MDDFIILVTFLAFLKKVLKKNFLALFMDRMEPFDQRIIQAVAYINIVILDSLIRVWLLDV